MLCLCHVEAASTPSFLCPTACLSLLTERQSPCLKVWSLQPSSFYVCSVESVQSQRTSCLSLTGPQSVGIVWFEYASFCCVGEPSTVLICILRCVSPPLLIPQSQFPTVLTALIPVPHPLVSIAPVGGLCLYLLARRANVSLSVIGVGVDFLQVVSLFSSFGFAWPSQLTSLFKVASASTVNEQLVGVHSLCDKAGEGVVFLNSFYSNPFRPPRHSFC